MNSKEKICSILAKREDLPKSQLYTGWYHFESDRFKQIEVGGKSCPLTGSLSNYSFGIGQKVWCYWKTADEKEKSYFEGEVIEMWDNATIVEENLPISNEEDGIAEGERYFHT